MPKDVESLLSCWWSVISFIRTHIFSPVNHLNVVSAFIMALCTVKCLLSAYMLCMQLLFVIGYDYTRLGLWCLVSYKLTPYVFYGQGGWVEPTSWSWLENISVALVSSTLHSMEAHFVFWFPFVLFGLYVYHLFFWDLLEVAPCSLFVGYWDG